MTTPVTRLIDYNRTTMGPVGRCPACGVEEKAKPLACDMHWRQFRDRTPLREGSLGATNDVRDALYKLGRENKIPIVADVVKTAPQTSLYLHEDLLARAIWLANPEVDVFMKRIVDVPTANAGDLGERVFQRDEGGWRTAAEKQAVAVIDVLKKMGALK